jgi:hypothetical protein
MGLSRVREKLYENTGAPEYTALQRKRREGMKRPLSTLALSLAALMVASAAYAQFMPKAIWTLTVVVNVPNAVIYVDNQQLPGNQMKVPGGLHNVKVMADGYLAFNGPVNVTRDTTFPVNLQPLRPVRPRGFPLTVNSNVPGAMVAVNNVPKGPVPYSEVLPPNTYTVRVSARGFVDYIATVSLDRPLVIDVPLQPVVIPSTLSFVIPQPSRDSDLRPEDPRAEVRIFIDGRLANPHREMERIPVQPGRHRIRVASGAFSVELGDMEFRPGTSYVLELGMAVKVRAEDHRQR